MWLVAILLFVKPVPAADRPLVAAASSLRFALQEIAERYRMENGQSVAVSFGSSGNLTRQIMGGAPFQLFLSADEAYVDKLEAAGLVAASAVYGVGRLVLFVAGESGLSASLSDFTAAVRRGRIDRIVIAHPERAPYGRAARLALRKAGLWELLQGRIVVGNNVSHAAQYLASGAVDAGFIAHSLALSSKLKARGSFVLLPQIEGEELKAKMALLAEAGEDAAAFYDYILEPVGQNILKAHGFGRYDE